MRKWVLVTPDEWSRAQRGQIKRFHELIVVGPIIRSRSCFELADPVIGRL